MALHGSAGFAEELPLPEIIELNVGGQVYITRSSTLTSVPDSLLFEMFSQKSIGGLARDTKGRFFLDRDGFLFRYILDYMRDQQLVLPDHFPERGRLKREAEFFHLPELVKMLAPKVCKQNSLADECCQSDPEESSPSVDFTRNFTSTASCSGLVSGLSDARGSGFITVGYRGSYTLGRDSQTDAKFRRVARIMVCGKTSLAKEVFGETLNESRDPDRPLERYTSRYYLKFTFLEQAFDRLSDAGFHMVACNSTGTCAFAHEQTDDKIWTNYTEYIFYRDKAPTSPHISDSGTLYNPHMSNNCSQEDTSNIFDLDNVSLPDFPPPLSLTLPLLENPEQAAEPGPLSHNSMSLSRPTTLPLKNIPRPPGSNSLATTTPVIARQNDGPRRKEPEEEEKKLIEEELKKCIDDFRKIRIPKLFPDRKRHWQSDLLQKYNA